MKERTKTWLLSCGFGTLLGTLPEIVATVPVASKTFDHVLAKLNYLLLPGILFNFLLSGWHVYDTQVAPTLLVNSIFYSLLIYGVIALDKKHQRLSASRSLRRS